MTNQIVTVNVTQTIAPIPNQLQQTGAFISQGGTTGAAQSRALLTQASDLTPLLTTPLAITTIVWSGGTATVTTTAPHGLTTSSVYTLTISGAVPTGYNGTYQATITGTSAFTVPIVSNPGTITTPGTWAPGSRAELVQMATTFFAQGSSVGIYVLELGTTTVAAGVTALTTWLGNNLATVYSFLVPRSWDAAASFLSFLASYEATTSKTYFYVTTTNTNYTNYTVLMKDVFALIEAPTVVAAGTEFTLASVFWDTLHVNPSSTNKVAPLSFNEEFGVTVYPAAGSSTIFQNWKTAGVNFIDVGSEGGIALPILKWGTFMDTRPWNYWFAVDWVQITVQLAVANAVINGSNNTINPLYLNQDGINRLQAVIFQTMSSGVTFGMVLGTVTQTELDALTFTSALENNQFSGQAVINAVPFASYYAQTGGNPSDYRLGVYNGFSITFTPLRGFVSITININVTDFVAP